MFDQYMRIVPEFIVGDEKYAWLNQSCSSLKGDSPGPRKLKMQSTECFSCKPNLTTVLLVMRSQLSRVLFMMVERLKDLAPKRVSSKAIILKTCSC